MPPDVRRERWLQLASDWISFLGIGVNSKLGSERFFILDVVQTIPVIDEAGTLALPVFYKCNGFILTIE